MAQLLSSVDPKQRTYTLLVASSADGDFLPFQQVWVGVSNRSLSSAHAAHINNALKQGFDFAFAKSEKNKGSHYSTLKTMKEVHPDTSITSII
jgi:hypothetical protein